MKTITITAATAASLIEMFQQAAANPNTAASPGYAGPVEINGSDEAGNALTVSVAFLG